MSTFLDRIKRRAALAGGPMDGRNVPMPLPETMPWPEFTCLAGPGPRPRVWHHYAHAADGSYRYAGPCAAIDHHGGAPHDHCEHQWDDATERGHRCKLVHGHEGKHACGCCKAEALP